MVRKVMVSTRGLEKAAVLAVLYNRSRTGGMGFMQYSPEPMTIDQGKEVLRFFERVTKPFLYFFTREVKPAADRIKFGYLQGRPMKVDLTSDDEFDAAQYDEYNGEGAAAGAIQALRVSGDVNPLVVQILHSEGVLEAIKETRSSFGEKSRHVPPAGVPGLGKVAVFHLGLDDVADVLGPRIDEVEKHLSAS